MSRVFQLLTFIYSVCVCVYWVVQAILFENSKRNGKKYIRLLLKPHMSIFFYVNLIQFEIISHPHPHHACNVLCNFDIGGIEYACLCVILRLLKMLTVVCIDTCSPFTYSFLDINNILNHVWMFLLEHCVLSKKKKITTRIRVYIQISHQCVSLARSIPFKP